MVRISVIGEKIRKLESLGGPTTRLANMVGDLGVQSHHRMQG